MDAQKNLRVLRERWAGCTKCGLSKLRGDTPVIFGSGRAEADFLLIMEAPTEDDAHQGSLMSGDEGQLVEDMLERAHIKADNVYVTSLVGCRPYAIIPATDDSPARTQSRSPDKTEAGACSPRILEIIYQVDPRMIIAMGLEPWKALVQPKSRGRHNTVATAAGELFDTYIPGRMRQVRYPVIATLAAKQLIANPSAAVHGPISTTIEAFIKAQRYVSSLKKKEEKK